MSEESLREIIGIAKKSKWTQVKRFIKFIIKKTLKKDAGYRLFALDASVNGKKRPNHNQNINSKEKVNEIDKIIDFNHLSLYQTTPTVNNHIEISQNNGTIIVLAKYFGPCLNNHQIFDFSVNLDALGEPFFTIGNGKKINSSEFLEIIHKRKSSITIKKEEKPKNKVKEVKDTEIQNIEAIVFEKVTNKNAIWNGTETKAFQRWKAKTKNKYRIDTGKITHYKGKPTDKFSLYLKSLLKTKDDKNKKPKKTLKPKINETEITEKNIFETVTGKNGVWNGAETKGFLQWKNRMHRKYKKDTRKNPYYKEQLTNNYKNYLKKTFKIP